MPTVASFHASDLSREQLRRMLAEHLALERAQVFRRLLVKRCGVIALIVVALGVSTSLIPSVGTWTIAGLFVAAPAGAWLRELHLQARVARVLSGVASESATAGTREGTPGMRTSRHVTRLPPAAH